MTLQLDHLFVLTERDAPISDLMIEAGFVEGSSNTHPGQGTANRRFFFNGFTLEWIFLNDENEARTGTGKDLQFADRLADNNASPFGIVVRSDTEVMFPHWLYWPDYFHGKMSFAVGDNSTNLNEPLCICMPIDLPKRASVAGSSHNPQALTGVDISVGVNQFSPVTQQFDQIPRVSLLKGESHSMVLTFDKGRAGKELNLMPKAPVRIRY